MGWLDKFRKNDDGAAASGDSVASPSGQASGPPPALTDADRGAILQLVQQEFARHGREVVPDGHGGLRGIDGRSFGTANIEASLRHTPREHWQDVIANHVRIMNGTIDAPGPDSFEEVRDRVYLRLRAVIDLPQPPSYDSPVLPGIVGMVTIDHPEHTQELGGVDSLGSWDQIRPVAIQNIRNLPPMDHSPVAADPSRADSTIHVFVTDDFFGPSRYFALDQLLARIGSPQPAPGLLIAIPNRHMIAIHEITGEGTVLAMNGLVNLAHGQYRDQPGALTPEVFYVGADGRTQQVTEYTGNEVAIHVKGALAETFQQVGIG